MIRRVLFAEKNWRPNGSASILINTGYYLVPDELSMELAEMAVKEGAAEVVEETKKPATTKAKA